MTMLQRLLTLLQRIKFTKKEREKIHRMRQSLACQGVLGRMSDEQVLELYEDMAQDKEL